MKQWVSLATATLCAWLIAYPLVAQQPNQPSDFRVQGDAQNRTTVNVPVTITTANTFQTILPSIVGTSTQRQSLEIQNNNTTGTDYCWVFVGSGTATESISFALAVGQAFTRYWPFVPSDSIQVTCASNGDTLAVFHQ